MPLSDQVSKRVEKSLQTKLKAHREKVGDDKRKQTTLRKLKICFNRGIGAYRNNPSSVRPTVTSPEQWAQARVNSFLYALRNLRYRSGKHDTDLLPKSHPQAGKEKKASKFKSYPDGETIPEALPEAYRPAAKDGETKGQACINCSFYAEDHKSDDEVHRFYCTKWKAQIRPQYWCAAWKAMKIAQKFERTYNDYPQTATDNAKKVLRWRDEHPDEIKGMTAIGWRRAGQLARREKLSRNTIARMASFKRHQKNAEIDPKFEGTPWKDAGYVAWLGWGGTTGVNWAIRKLEQIDKEAKSKMEKKFAFGVVGMEKTNVDRENGIMEGVSLISEGPALGHGLFVDSKSIETIDDQLDDTKLPAYITHRGALFEDRLTREIGMFRNFRIQDDRLMGDFEAFESFREDDNKKFNRLFEMAEKIPERFGLSIVFSATSAWATPDGDVPMGRFPNNDSDRLYDEKNPPEDALFEFPSIRVEEVTSADFVDSPAANQRGLFAKIDNQPVYKMTKAELIKKNEELEAEMAELAECVEQFTQAAKLSEDEDKELGGHEDDELGGHEDEEEKAAAEALEEENAKLKSEIEELKQKLAEDEEKMAELQSELDGHKEEEMKKDEELAEAASQLSAKNDEVSEKETRIIELQAIVKGSEAVKFSKDDGDYSPSLSNRNQLIAQYAKDHKISEFSATLKLAKEKPEIFNI
jgi:hypothetical protein